MKNATFKLSVVIQETVNNKVAKIKVFSVQTLMKSNILVLTLTQKVCNTDENNITRNTFRMKLD